MITFLDKGCCRRLGSNQGDPGTQNGRQFGGWFNVDDEMEMLPMKFVQLGCVEITGSSSPHMFSRRALTKVNEWSPDQAVCQTLNIRAGVKLF